jgi:homoserine/homoserine lactone efflux protein
MNWTLFSAFIAATAVLIIIPGPNVMLVISRSMRFGVKAGLITVAGTAFALAQQLAITALGLASAMAILSDGFEVLRWLGVAYLVYLGVQAFREKPVPPEAAAAVATPGTGRMFFQAAFVAWTNPKLLAFYAAFFPQFLDPALPAGPQLWAMCGAFLAIAVLFDSGYAVIGGRLLGTVKSERAQRIRNRITGGILIAAGAGLAMVRRA